MATHNLDAIPPGVQFQARRPPSHPQEDASKHQFSEEFHATVIPPGSAPSDRTFKPNPDLRHVNPPPNPDAPEGYTPPAETITGATSRDVDKGLGHPVYGQSSRELHHEHPREKRQGKTRFATGKPGVELGSVDPRIDGSQRALDREDLGPTAGRTQERGDKGAVAAEDLPPVSAEEAARELQ